MKTIADTHNYKRDSKHVAIEYRTIPEIIEILQKAVDSIDVPDNAAEVTTSLRVESYVDSFDDVEISYYVDCEYWTPKSKEDIEREAEVRRQWMERDQKFKAQQDAKLQKEIDKILKEFPEFEPAIKRKKSLQTKLAAAQHMSRLVKQARSNKTVLKTLLGGDDEEIRS